MDELSIDQLIGLYDSGQITIEKVVSQYLERIEDLNPKIKAVIEVNPDALEIAQMLDEEMREKGRRSPLYGIPIIIKDNIDTKDKMKTSAGSLALKNHIASKDAFIVKKIRDAGGVIIAKANLSEWANFRGKRSISGWSSRGGQTRNPYVLDRTPCGSSSGSAVAVAANLCVVAVGTETDGSIICPSHTNGIVGLKPTMGLVSRSGIVPISHTQDIAGPMARSVKDCSYLLEALVGVDPADKVTMKQPREVLNYSQALSTNALQNAVIGVGREYFGFSPNVDTILNNAIKKMSELGAKLIDPLEIPLPEGSLGETEVLLTDYYHDLNTYLQSVDPSLGIRSIEDLIKFNKENAEQTMPYFGQEFFELALTKTTYENDEYQKAMEQYETLRRNLFALFDESSLDAIFLPSGSPAWPIDFVNGDCSRGSTSFLAAISGFPAITIPLGYLAGLPVGGTFMGKPFSEQTLLKLSYAFEQAHQVRQPPQFKPTLGIPE